MMISCDDVRPQLTSYLDGELEGPSGSVVRGHLRTCAGCRTVAADEAALRDGLRALPSVDVPASLWSGVQARLAAAEVADAERPSWRRALARWTPSVRRFAPSIGGFGLAAAAAASLLVWHAHKAGQGDAPTPPTAPLAVITPTQPAPTPTPAPDPLSIAPSDDDVTADLAREAARTSAAYAATADSLATQLADARTTWPDDRRARFDARLTELRAAVTSADQGQGRQRALRAEIRYLQGALIRDEIASNDRMLAAPGRTP